MFNNVSNGNEKRASSREHMEKRPPAKSPVQRSVTRDCTVSDVSTTAIHVDGMVSRT